MEDISDEELDPMGDDDDFSMFERRRIESRRETGNQEGNPGSSKRQIEYEKYKENWFTTKRKRNRNETIVREENTRDAFIAGENEENIKSDIFKREIAQVLPKENEQSEVVAKEEEADEVAQEHKNPYWTWHGVPYMYEEARRYKPSRKYYREVRKGSKSLEMFDTVLYRVYGDSTPHVGRIIRMWQESDEMQISVDKFLRYDQDTERPLKYPNAIFHSGIYKTIDVESIIEECTILSLEDYKLKFDDDLEKMKESYNFFYLAGYYDSKCNLGLGIPLITK